MQIRSSTFLGGAFAALLLVIGGSSLAIWRNVMAAQERVAALHGTQLAEGNALASIRANVYLIGILTRDFLLEPDAQHERQYSEQFAAIRKSIADNFQQLQGTAHDDSQRAALDRLRRGVDAYWDPTALILDWTVAQRTARRTDFLKERVRRREEIDALTREVERLMTESFSREQERVTTANREFQTSLGWITAMALLLGLGIAVATMTRMVSLERRSAASESELRRLSGQVRSAQEQERKYLSRELHDQVGQMLTGLRMELSGMARLPDEAGGELAARIVHAKGIVEQTLRIVRNIAMLLRPSMLDDLGLAPALTWLVKEISKTSGMEIETHIDPALDSLPDTHRTCLYRVVQEALTNVSRHGQASKAEVTLHLAEGWVGGTIADNGRGFDVGLDKREGLGLVGMRERARELGGVIHVQSSPGYGTRIEIRLPIAKGVELADDSKPDSNPDRGRPWDRPDRIETSAGSHR